LTSHQTTTTTTINLESERKIKNKMVISDKDVKRMYEEATAREHARRKAQRAKEAAKNAAKKK
jgi:hypothetical protein